jgi:hypothetical protein
MASHSDPQQGRSSTSLRNPPIDLLLLEEMRELRALVINLIPALITGYLPSTLHSILNHAREVKQGEAEHLLSTFTERRAMQTKEGP